MSQTFHDYSVPMGSVSVGGNGNRQDKLSKWPELSLFVFQTRNKKCEDTRDIPARSRSAPGCHRNKKKRAGSPKVVEVTDEDRAQPAPGVENINPRRRRVKVKTVKVRQSSHPPGNCQVLHSVPSNNNREDRQVLNKYHFFGQSIQLSDDEGIGSAESLTSDQQYEN